MSSLPFFVFSSYKILIRPMSELWYIVLHMCLDLAFMLSIPLFLASPFVNCFYFIMDQKLTKNFFCKGLGSKYFRLWAVVYSSVTECLRSATRPQVHPRHHKKQKYFRLCGLVSVKTTRFCHCRVKAATALCK